MIRAAIVLSFATILTACATRTVYVDRPRTVEVAVPVPAKIPAELLQACPQPAATQTFGDWIEYMKLCLSLLEFQREKLVESQSP